MHKYLQRVAENLFFNFQDLFFNYSGNLVNTVR